MAGTTRSADYILFIYFGGAQIEPRASHMLGKCYTTELHPQPSPDHLNDFGLQGLGCVSGSHGRQNGC
jgi:hypothetical protein